MLKVEFIDTFKYELGIPWAMFLLGDLEQMRDMPVAIFGAGMEAYFAYHFLCDKGIEAECFVNNDRRMVGKEFCGVKVVLPKEIIGEEYYIVIAMSRLRYDNEVLWQLRLGGHRAWGLVFPEKFHSFISQSGKNDELHTTVMDVLNRLWIGDKTIDEVVGHIMNCGNSLNVLGVFSELGWTTTWSHRLLKWFYEMYSDGRGKNKEMLEIGAGQGVFSLVAKSICPDMDIKWLMFEMNEMSSVPVDGRYETFPANLFSTYYGLIEHPEYRIEDKFDVIVMTEVMEHFTLNPVNTLRKIGDMLKPGGAFFLSTPNWGHLPYYESYTQLPEFTTLEDYKARQIGHAYQYNKEELEEVMDKAGLMIERYALSDANSHNLILRRKED